MPSVAGQSASLVIRESGALFVIGLALLSAPAVISLVLYRHAVFAAVVGLWLVAVAVSFSSLHVLVSDGRLRVKLGGLLTVRQVPLSEITAVQRFRTPGFAGLGVRFLTEGTLYTVTLGDAVEIRLRDGTRFFVGSGTPDVMCAQLQSAVDAATTAPLNRSWR